jgi:hypothetical protein
MAGMRGHSRSYGERAEPYLLQLLDILPADLDAIQGAGLPLEH